MKVSCQSCSAHYNLPDDKVRGRKAKVRCKKCGASIVVDGTTVEGTSGSPAPFFGEEDEATRVMEMPVRRPGPSAWTVNLSDEDQRDMTAAEIVAGWLSKTVTDDAYVWREGMEEWLPVLAAPELGDAIRQADPNAGRAVAAGSVDPMFLSASVGSVPSGAGSGPVASAPAPVSAPQAAAAPPASQTDLSPPAPKAAERPRSEPKATGLGAKATTQATAAKTAKPQTSGTPAKRPSVTAGLFGPYPDKGKPVPAKPTGRPDPFAGAAAADAAKTSENSVMFSLDALKAAAAVEPSGKREQDTRISEDLLVMGGPGGYDLNPLPLIQVDMPPPAPVPVAAPVSLGGATPLGAGPPKSSGSMMSVLMIVGGLVVIAGVFFGVRAFTSNQVGTASADAPATSAQAGERKATQGEATKEAAEPAAEVNGAGSAAASAAPAAQETPSAAPVTKPPNPGAGGAPAPKPQAAVTPPKAGGGAAPAPKPESGGGGGGKGAFNVGAAKDALGSAASQAKLCKTGDGPTGSGKVQVTFAPSGRVTNANVNGPPFAGTGVGGCVARAFRGARVPPFDGAPQTVSKGFTIN